MCKSIIQPPKACECAWCYCVLRAPPPRLAAPRPDSNRLGSTDDLSECLGISCTRGNLGDESYYMIK